MFCTSLRKRSEWASIVPELNSSQVPTWQERELNTHDIAIRLQSSPNGEKKLFRMILLSVSDLDSPSFGISRIEHLVNLDAAGGVTVIFLLNEKGCKNSSLGMKAYMALQIKLQEINLHVQIIPLISTTSLQQTLLAFSRQILQYRVSGHMINPITEILPHCTNGPRLSEHACNVLSDICPDMRGLAEAATTPDGQARLREYLSDPSPQVAEDVIQFWHKEYLAM